MSKALERLADRVTEQRNRLLDNADAVRQFITMIALMTTEEEMHENDGDGMSGDDAVETVSNLIREARALSKKLEG